MSGGDSGGEGARDEGAILAALYAAPLSEFIALRKAGSAELRKGGDRAAAARVKTLAKPSTAAWIANALHRERSALWNAAMDGGRQLRSAQGVGGVTAERMQRLVGEQRGALSALLREADGVASAAGLPLNRAQEGKLRATLEALCAGVDAGVPGQLSVDLAPPSFDALGGAAFAPQTPAPSGEATAPASEPTQAQQAAPGRQPPVPPAAATATPQPAERTTTPTVTPRDRERAHALQQLRDLESIRDTRSAQRRKVMSQVRTATEELERARAEVAVAQRRLQHAEQEAQAMQSRLDTAQLEQARLTEAVKQAQQAVAEANAALASSD